MATAVEVHDLKAWFGKTEALHGINMDAMQTDMPTLFCASTEVVRC